MHGKARLLDDKGNLIGSGKQTKGNLFYLDLGDCSCLLAQVEESWLWHKCWNVPKGRMLLRGGVNQKY